MTETVKTRVTRLHGWVVPITHTCGTCSHTHTHTQEDHLYKQNYVSETSQLWTHTHFSLLCFCVGIKIKSGSCSSDEVRGHSIKAISGSGPRELVVKDTDVCPSPLPHRRPWWEFVFLCCVKLMNSHFNNLQRINIWSVYTLTGRVVKRGS